MDLAARLAADRPGAWLTEVGGFIDHAADDGDLTLGGDHLGGEALEMTAVGTRHDAVVGIGDVLTSWSALCLSGDPPVAGPGLLDVLGCYRRVMANVFDTGKRAAVADEGTTLEVFLDYYRAAVMAKVRGVSEEDGRRQLVPSATTLAGIIKHLCRVEVSWFQHRLAQIPSEDLPALRWIEDDPDGDFRIAPDETVEMLIAQYDEQCARSRQTAARFNLDEVVPHPYLGEVSLRWIYVHMIEETARHAGHADILREQLDGTTGD